ncbi:hypothetical protein WG906_10180 [Pedobacter sp. P351]|uniref:hypothetical protein n=1 Tax=Pedobacter superstes TaxID=3133441 RepID=UPI0030A2B24D
MLQRKYIPFLTLLFIFFACNSGKQMKTVEDSVAIDTMRAEGQALDTSSIPKLSKQIKPYKGLFILGNEVSAFTDCNNGKLYWLEDKSKKLLPAYKKSTQFLSYPYESVYLEVKGYLKGKSNMGYAGDYENVLVVTDLITSKQKSFHTDCFNYEFIGLGNEPFWSLEIIPSEKIIALKDVGNDKTYTFPYNPGKSSASSTIYESYNDKKQSIKAIITKQKCSDGMSDRIYNYAAEVTIDGRTLKGCAIKKGDNIK